MKGMLFVFCLFVSVALCGQAPEFEWAVQQGGGFVDNGFAIATDTFGNVYTTGSFSNNQALSDTADFDPGTGFYGLFSNGGADIFVSKLSPDGDLLWAVSFGDEEGDYGHGITTDASGNVYVTGLFHGGIDFDPGPDVYSLYAPLNHSSVFVLKLDTNGSLLWARELGDGEDFAPGSSWGYSIAVDDDGNVYTTGRAKDNTDFDPGPGEYLLTTNTNSPNVFISKLDSNGNFVWAKAIGGVDGEQSYALALDDFSNVYITGNFQDEIDFDPGPGEFNLIAIGNGDLYILKLNSDGNFVWAKNIGGDSTSAWGFSLVIDDIGNIYTTGLFLGFVDFNPGQQTYELYSNGGDVFVLKLNTNGEFIWAKSIGGEGGDFGNGIALDNYNNIYVTGYFQDTVDFNPDLETYNLFSGRDAGVYILKLTEDGSFVWAVAFPGDEGNYPGEYNVGEGIALDQWNNVYTTGSFWRTTDFDPDTSTYNLTHFGTTDIFVQKMSQPCNASVVINSSSTVFTICSGDTIMLFAGLPANLENLSYAWNTGESNDSILVTPDSTSVFSVFINYTNNNLTCNFSDSIEVVVLEKVDTTFLDFTTCDSTAVGVESIVLSSANNCDSIVIITTSLIPMPATPTAPDDLVIAENEPPFQLMITEVPYADSYFWEVPLGVQILSGQGTNSIVVDWDDQITTSVVCVSAINKCGSSTSDCMEVSVDVIDEVKTIQPKNYLVFPNPTTSQLNIMFPDNQQYDVLLFNSLGQKVNETIKSEQLVILLLENLPNGLYWLFISCTSCEEGQILYREAIEILH